MPPKSLKYDPGHLVWVTDLEFEGLSHSKTGQCSALPDDIVLWLGKNLARFNFIMCPHCVARLTSLKCFFHTWSKSVWAARLADYWGCNAHCKENQTIIQITQSIEHTVNLLILWLFIRSKLTSNPTVIKTFSSEPQVSTCWKCRRSQGIT